MTKAPFKTRFANHKLSLKNKNYSISTVLSKDVCCVEYLRRCWLGVGGVSMEYWLGVGGVCGVSFGCWWSICGVLVGFRWSICEVSVGLVSVEYLECRLGAFESLWNVGWVSVEYRWSVGWVSVE